MPWRRILNGQGPGPQVEPGQAAASLVAQARAAESLTAPVQALADALARTDPHALPDELAKVAFWLNAYNGLMRHAVLALRPTGSVITNLLLFERVSYRVGGAVLSLNEIEHGVLRRNARALPFYRRPFSRGDGRRALMAARLDPRIHFALNCGAVSCPPIRAYAGSELDAQLALATTSYLAAHTRVDVPGRRVTLSRLMKLYARDFGTRADAVRFTARHLDGEAEARFLLEHAETVRVSFGPYDWTLV